MLKTDDNEFRGLIQDAEILDVEVKELLIEEKAH